MLREGETRYTSGTTPTTFRFTGQRAESGIGLYFYNSRYYDSSLGRFTQADTIVPQPGNVLAWDRYSYTMNNPVRYTDPSGHDVGCPAANPICEESSGYKYQFGRGYRGHEWAEFQRWLKSETRESSSISYRQTYCLIPLPPKSQTNIGPSSSQKSTLSPGSFEVSTNLSPEQKAVLGDWVSNSTSMGPVAVKGLQSAENVSLPWLVVGSSASGYSQWERDSDISLSTPQRLSRAVIYGFESAATSIAGNYIGISSGLAGMAVGGPVGAIAGYMTGYVLTVNLLSVPIQRFNERSLFPMLNLGPDGQ